MSADTKLSPLRQGKVTSSIAAAALGLNPHATPIDAWMSVTGQRESIDTKPTERGHLLEEIVLDYPCEVLGVTRLKAPFIAHPNGWAGDSADALYIPPGAGEMLLGEGKTVAGRPAEEYGEEGTDKIPEQHIVQCQWHLAHRPEIGTCLVPVLVGGFRFEFRLYRVERDAELIGLLMQDLERWHRDYVMTGNPPPAQAGDTEALTRIYSRNTDGMIEATPEIERLARDYAEAREASKVADGRKDAIANQLRQLFGHSEGAAAYWGSATWKNNKDAPKLDLDRLRANHPDIIEKYTTMQPGPRVLRVSLKKEKRQP